MITTVEIQQAISNLTQKDCLAKWQRTTQILTTSAAIRAFKN